MPSYPAIIKITNLRLRTLIGFNPEERTKPQDVVINAEIHHDLNQGAMLDVIEDALNYKTITKKMIHHVETNSFLLLEKLTADLTAICSQHPSVKRAVVTVDKPHALRFADSVSLTLEYDRKLHSNTQETLNEPEHTPFSKAS